MIGKTTMRIATTLLLATAILAGNSLAEDQRVNITNAGFDPDVIRAAPGDSVTWRWLQFGGGVSLSSGEPCTADGLFQFKLTGGMGGNPVGTWEVPVDFAYDVVPYFNNATCEDGMTASIRIIDVREVPGEYPTIQQAIDAADEYDGDLPAATAATVAAAEHSAEHATERCSRGAEERCTKRVGRCGGGEVARERGDARFLHARRAVQQRHDFGVDCSVTSLRAHNAIGVVEHRLDGAHRD